MPLFSSKKQHAAPPPPVHQEVPPKKHGLFSHRREPSVSSVSSSSMSGGSPTRHGTTSKKGLFRRSHDTTATDYSNDSHRRSTGNGKLSRGLNMLGGNHEMDPSIVRAREHVVNAEAAEKDADRALEEARRRVKEAREHVKRLEEEAREEARLAKIKQHHAAEVSRRGKGLGRKCYPSTIRRLQSHHGKSETNASL